MKIVLGIMVFMLAIVAMALGFFGAMDFINATTIMQQIAALLELLISAVCSSTFIIVGVIEANNR